MRTKTRRVHQWVAACGFLTLRTGCGAVPKDDAAAAHVLHECLVYGVLRALLFWFHECVAHCECLVAAHSLRGLGCTDAGIEAVAFCLAHAEAARQVMLYCICGAAGQVRLAWRSRLCAIVHAIVHADSCSQNFIFFAISNYGSLVNITITTTRKVRARATG